MIQALVADFTALQDMKVVTTLDSRISNFHPPNCRVTKIASQAEELLAIERLAAASDWTLLIAPETDQLLAARCRLVESAGGRLISPSLACVEVASSKQATASLLQRAGVPAPKGNVQPGAKKCLPSGMRYPVVVKPVDGCASQGVQLVRSDAEWPPSAEPIRIEEFVPGLAASVAVLCGPAGNHALPACEQHLSSNGQFKYLGGRLPLSPEFDSRARSLAIAAAKALPQPVGYVGVDLVLGAAPDGADDRVIEINPRLTTSYIGLRAAARENLAAAMLAVATGNPPNLSFGSHEIQFKASGPAQPTPDS
jgi:predicted ATP-grasp superfamily ATP-dependent carboligase